MLAACIDPISNPFISKEISINGGGRIFDSRAIHETDTHEAMSRVKVKKSMITSLANFEDCFTI